MEKGGKGRQREEEQGNMSKSKNKNKRGKRWQTAPFIVGWVILAVAR